MLRETVNSLKETKILIHPLIRKHVKTKEKHPVRWFLLFQHCVSHALAERPTEKPQDPIKIILARKRAASPPLP